MIDLTSNNPLKRSLEESANFGKAFSIESARLLVKHIFDDSRKLKSNLELRILMQAVPIVLN